MFLAIGIWLIHDNWDIIKAFTKQDWLLLATALLLCFGLVFVYFIRFLNMWKLLIIQLIRELDLTVDLLP